MKLELALLILILVPFVIPAVDDVPLPHEILDARGIVFSVKLLLPVSLQHKCIYPLVLK